MVLPVLNVTGNVERSVALNVPPVKGLTPSMKPNAVGSAARAAMRTLEVNATMVLKEDEREGVRG